MYRMASEHLLAKRADDAIAQLTKALALVSGDIRFLLLRAAAYRKKVRYQQAENTAERLYSLLQWPGGVCLISHGHRGSV